MNRPREAGFTLLELMIVVIVMALVLSVSYPALSRGTTALHLRATGRDILNAFRYAREKAVTEQTGMKIRVDREKQALFLTDDLDEGNRAYFLPGDVKIERVAQNGSEIVNGPLVIRFLPNGSSEDAEILLKSSTGSSLRIISDQVTGGARIESGTGENR
jgi:prepilin-type N-terminal cleavage/methylation domain-containing protein